MNETLQEYVDSRGIAVRVDAEAAVIHGVKILGLDSQNGRNYPPETLAAAVGLYEGAKVNVNHPPGRPTAPRDYRDRIGAIRNVAVREGEGLFGDLHFNPKHALAEQLVWDASHAPENVGFSHNVEARLARRDGKTIVEAITRVQSVDLVADPATTRGLFESTSEETDPITTPEQLRESYSELVDQLFQEQIAELNRLQSEIDRLSASDTMHRKCTTLRRLLREHGLPEPESADPLDQAITSERFVETLLAAKDERAMRTLVEERAALVRTLGREVPNTPPVSRDQRLPGEKPVDTQGFVDAIT